MVSDFVLSLPYEGVSKILPSLDPENYPERVKNAANTLLRLSRDEQIKVWHIVNLRQRRL